MLVLLTLVTAAVAATPDPSGDIVQVPGGSVVTPLEGEPFTLPVPGYFLPGPMYDRALIKAKQLEVCQPALDAAADQVLQWAEVGTKALTACSAQLDEDEALTKDLVGKVQTLESRALVAEGKVVDLRAQRNVAWAVTTGLLIGAAVAAAVAIGT